jgi:hypothetical protein
MVKGLQDFQTVFKAIAADFKLCQADTADKVILDKIEAYLKTFPDVESFKKHINGDLEWNSV